MNKVELLKKVIARLTSDLELMQRAAIEARDSVIHPDAKQEGKYDTRAIEASYLAGAQAERAADLERMIGKLANLAVTTISSTVKLGSVVEATIDSKPGHYFIVPEGGGLTVDHNGLTVQVIASASPLAVGLMGREPDDEFDFDIGGKKKAVVVVSLI